MVLHHDSWMTRLSSIPLCSRSASIASDFLVDRFQYLLLNFHVLVQEILGVIRHPTRLAVNLAWLLRVVTKPASPLPIPLLKNTPAALVFLLGTQFRDGLRAWHAFSKLKPFLMMCVTPKAPF
jgi:hypothetical protein